MLIMPASPAVLPPDLLVWPVLRRHADGNLLTRCQPVAAPGCGPHAVSRATQHCRLLTPAGLRRCMARRLGARSSTRVIRIRRTSPQRSGGGSNGAHWWFCPEVI